MENPSEESLRFRFESDFAKGEVDTIYADDETPIRVLKVGDAFQSATFLGELKNELPFEYFRRFFSIARTMSHDFDECRILLLGAGALSFPKRILSEPNNVSVVAIERDPKIIEIAREHFYVSDLEETLDSKDESRRLEIVVDDALDYLRDHDGVFAIIINDLFDGEEQVLAFEDDEGLELIRDHLLPDGLYMINYVCGEAPADFFELRKLLDKLQNVFGHAQAIIATDEEFSDFDNYILVASAIDRVFEGEIGRS